MSTVLPLGVQVRQAREQAGLSRIALARRIGVSEVGIGFIEKGDRRAPRFDTVVKLARALDLAPQALFDTVQ
jgi:DNA-binding XRE family transcriptional regulator